MKKLLLIYLFVLFSACTVQKETKVMTEDEIRKELRKLTFEE